MRSKIQSRKDYDSEVKGDPIKLLQAIKKHSMSYESTQHRMKTTCEAMKPLVNIRMKEDEKSIDYLKRFKASRDAFYSHVGKDLVLPKVLEDHEKYQQVKKKEADFLALEEELSSLQEKELDDLKEEMDTIRRAGASVHLGIWKMLIDPDMDQS